MLSPPGKKRITITLLGLGLVPYPSFLSRSCKYDTRDGVKPQANSQTKKHALLTEFD